MNRLFKTLFSAAFALSLLIVSSLGHAQNTGWKSALEQDAKRLDRLHTLVVTHEGEEILALDLKNQGLGRQIFPEGWVEASWAAYGESAYTDDPYGYGWFQRPLGGEMGYYGRGYGGQVLYVMPALALTVVMTSDPTPPSPGSVYLRQQFRLIEDHIIPALR